MLAAVEAGEWRPLTVAEGAQGPRTYRFVARRVWESRAGLPGRACWLVLRRNPDGTEPKAYLANAPADTPLLQLAEVGAQRWAIETAFQQAKGEAGLDEYEVRSWAGWHHHVTLVLLAAAFLLTIQQAWGESWPTSPCPRWRGCCANCSPAATGPGASCGLVGHHPAPATPAPNSPIAAAAFPVAVNRRCSTSASFLNGTT